jgi:Zn-dependent peptidase ImmA (M78 family)
MATRRAAEAEAERVLRESGHLGDIPIDIENVARSRGAQVIRERLDRDVSGLLFRDGDSVVIGVNDLHAARRQRFTVAHEVAHLVLHKGRPLVLDHVRVNFRDKTSSAATDYEEIEANQFAAAILMPAALVEREAKRLLQDPSATDASIVPLLAQGFEVSDQAMEIRLTNLGFRRQV